MLASNPLPLPPCPKLWDTFLKDSAVGKKKAGDIEG
jgi:hypothetical protein